jgi:hypothetical protein
VGGPFLSKVTWHEKVFALLPLFQLLALGEVSKVPKKGICTFADDYKEENTGVILKSHKNPYHGYMPIQALGTFADVTPWNFGG